MSIRCTIDGCDKPQQSRGWCAMHYTRWLRHGSPLALLVQPLRPGQSLRALTDSDIRRFWSKVSLPTESGCMLWLPKARDSDGYGRFRLGQPRNLRAHRVSLLIAVGAPAASDLMATHSCRNKHCVAPAHLRWATHAENEADKVRDGTILRGDRHPRTKLSDAQALEIRSRYAAGGITYKQLADEYGVYWDTIGLIIRRGKRFAPVAERPYETTLDESERRGD